MDLLSIFEQRLNTNHQPLEIAEEKWDQRAEVFYKNQVHGSLPWGVDS